ncbi:B12-binding domain-containing protein [Actibacterium sp. 188UL27-1]|uniref:cobalamin B12-binding domain-containing protein n=1 Tax=Actibacterium sp. 188UL27-1 TaxID=2786961 RepID=UPI00195B2AEF|nr:cobalamin B12-binding domain-containing protein [Actibacterium sp. 188UL27-1]MBM7068606.1 cobalamin B12-binding domain-containing protein [Actibacterium sp. 188UL27-1]
MANASHQTPKPISNRIGLKVDGSNDLSILNFILDAVLAVDRSRFDRMVEDVRDLHRIQPEKLIDHYIPEAAQILGREWCADHMSFAEVTIGSARLQSWVRDLDRDFDTRSALDDLDGPSVLLVIPPNTFHTLGTMVALSQFRRAGASVRLLICQKIGDVRQALAQTSFDMVALSAPGGTSLDLLRQMVENIRYRPGKTPLIVVGGGLLALEPETKILIGADFAAHDPKEALALCGLKICTTGAPPRATRV